jgi:hypothetical protein
MNAARRFTTCRCCGGFASSAYCSGCGAHNTQRLAVAQAAVLALWGTAGLARWQTELRARRLSARRTTRPERKARS